MLEVLVTKLETLAKPDADDDVDPDDAAYARRWLGSGLMASVCRSSPKAAQNEQSEVAGTISRRSFEIGLPHLSQMP